MVMLQKLDVLTELSHKPHFRLMMVKKKAYGLYPTVYSVNPVHHRQETKESIIIVFTVCTGWYRVNYVEETKKLADIKNKQGVRVRKEQWSTMLTLEAKTMALNAQI